MSQGCPRCGRSLDLPAQAAFCPYCGQSLSPAGTSEADTPPTRLPDATPPSGPTDTVAAPPGGWADLSVSLFVPERVGGYRLLRRLGQGGMGTVYEAEDEATGRRVAVKMIDFHATGDALTRFRQEGKLASALSHPRCVFVYAADQDAGRPFIVMELMPGRTLDDLVRQRGPLPVEEAIGYTLDLIEGLEQVHALGVIHRDVKPSNSFLDTTGGVKVGDFGLARSLHPDAKLTRTGTFIGTPLFAAPEQVKGEPLDVRADVYAVSATLYFLLTGRAPHDREEGDVVAVLARVAADEAPPVRSRRPELSRGLDRVLARGLARDRDRRHPDIASLRADLLAFREAPGLGVPLRRFAAYFLDGVLATMVQWPLALALGLKLFDPSPPAQWLNAGVSLSYFWLCEGLLGYTAGKRLLGLRVWGRDDVVHPTLGKAFVRVCVFEGVCTVPGLLLGLIYPVTQGDDGRSALVLSAVLLASVALLVCTMRRRNGYLCLHDLLSSTRVVDPRPAARGVRHRVRHKDSVARPLPELQRLGRFRVQGEVRGEGGESVLRAAEPGLDRAVWLWLRPAGRPEVPAARRESATGDRPRWLACGTEGDQRWDAFLAPAGAPLLDAIQGTGKRDWEDAGPILLDLAGRLADAPGVAALTGGYSLSRVWLSPEGRVLLIDVPVASEPPLAPLDLIAEAAVVLLEAEGPNPGRSGPPGAQIPGHARRLLAGLPRFGGTLKLGEFRERLAEDAARPAALPRGTRVVHVSLLLAAQLFCCGGFLSGAYGTPMHNLNVVDVDLRAGRRVLHELDQNSAACAAALTAPAHPLERLGPALEVDRLQRVRPRLARAVAGAGPYRDARFSRLGEPLRAFIEASGEQPPPPAPGPPASLARQAEDASVRLEMRPWPPAFQVLLAAGSMAFPVAICVLSAFAFRGGLRYPLLGVEIVRRDGRPARRFRCAWRALLAWLPIVAVIVLARWVEESYWARWTPGGRPAWMLVLADVCWVLAVAVPLACLAAAVITPRRSLHDRLAGTWLVPR